LPFEPLCNRDQAHSPPPRVTGSGRRAPRAPGALNFARPHRCVRPGQGPLGTVSRGGSPGVVLGSLHLSPKPICVWRCEGLVGGRPGCLGGGGYGVGLHGGIGGSQGNRVWWSHQTVVARGPLVPPPRPPFPSRGPGAAPRILRLGLLVQHLPRPRRRPRGSHGRDLIRAEALTTTLNSGRHS